MNFRSIRDKIKRVIYGANENLPLERRIQILLTFLTAIIFFIGIVFNIIVNLNVWFTALIALSTFIIAVFFFISRNSKNYQRLILPLFLISILLLPAGWFLNAGYDGTILNLIFIYFLAQYAIVKPKYRIIVFLTFVCLSCSLIIVQHSFPEFVLSYSNDDQRFWDILFSTILYFVLFYFFIDIIVKNYSTENQKIVSINEELKIKNKQIAENIIRLEESEETYRVITQSTVDIIFIVDKLGKLLFVNDSVSKYYGYTVDELVGKSFVEFAPASELQNYLLQLNNVFLHNEVSNYVTQIYHKDGHLVDVEINGKIIKRNGERVSLGTIRDISDRKNAEKKIGEVQKMLYRIINLLPVRIFWKDKDLKYLGCNEIFAHDAGKNNPDELIGKDDFDMGWKEQAELYRLDDQNVIANGLPKLNYEEPQTTSSGNTIWINTSKVPLTDSDGGVVGILGAYEDISERRQAEEALKASESKYHELYSLIRLMSDTMPDLIWAKDLDNKYIFANKAMCDKLLGATDTLEPVGKTDLYFALRERDSHPENPQWHTFGELCQDSDVITLKEMKEMQFNEYGNVKGKFLFLDVRKAPLFNNEGKLIGVVGSARDVTNQKKIEETIRLSHHALESISEFLTITDLSDRFTYVNQAFLDAYGYSREEVIGQTPKLIWSENNRKELLREILDHSKVGMWNGEVLNRTKEGREILINLSTSQVKDNEGKIIGLVGISKDITERKRFEEAIQESEIFFRSVWEHSSSGMRLTDEGGTIISVNKSFCEMIGKTEKELIRSSLAVIYMENEHSHIVQKHQERFSARTVPAVIEKELLLWNGKKVWFEVQNSFIDFGNGKILLLGIFNNITEQKNSEQIIRDIQRRESIGVLAGGIAHDFNNLLTSMIGNVSLAQAYIHDGHPARVNLARIISAAERAATLTKQMLAYSGKGRFQIVSVDLIKLVEEYIGLYEASLPKNVSIVTHLSSMPVYVKGDPGQIEQIVMNLIINAGEAIGAKNGIVDVGVFAIEMSDEALKPFGSLNNQVLQSGEYAFFQVTDTGVGMNNETMTKIFDPFFTTKFVGRGLGLSAVLGIIRGHNGGITVYSTESGGTTFQVILPLIKPDVHKEQRQDYKNIPSSFFPTILVIDDEQDVIDMTNDVLTNEKYQHYSALDPEKGIQLFKEHWKTIDLVVLDYSMPKMNGKEVLIELRKIAPDIIVVMSSGYSEEELNHLMGDIKPSAFIQKPHRPKDLLLVIQSLVKDR